MPVIVIARCVALLMCAIMTVYLAVDGAHRPGNPFLVPDVAVAVLLGVGAVLPKRAAVPAMLFAFAWTAGVITVSYFTQAVRGEHAWDNLALVAAALAMAVALAAAPALRRDPSP
ncbi:hypothetical protein [Nonomuraea longicatena]|uniref:Integral membrane protein n=1 Tax=Nonomuraea longicatena TaxID=83682 RepID=A0ABP3ZCQ1_9ACTN